MSQELDPKLLAFILNAPKRQIILNLLTKDRLLPSQIIKKTGMYQSHVSRALKELLDKKLAICENPSDLKSRFYKATELGKQVAEKVRIIIKDLE